MNKGLTDILEPAINQTWLEPTSQADLIQLSIAISLKRIADAQEQLPTARPFSSFTCDNCGMVHSI